MKMNKILVLVLTALFMLSGDMIFAQPGGGPGGKGGPGGPGRPSEEQITEHVKEMADKVGLSDGQVEKIVAIRLEQFDAMEEAKQNASGDRAKMRETMEKLRDETNNKIKAVMTQEQYKKFEEYEKNNRRGPRGKGGPPSRRE